jgi:hypothetical protein
VGGVAVKRAQEAVAALRAAAVGAERLAAVADARDFGEVADAERLAAQRFAVGLAGAAWGVRALRLGVRRARQPAGAQTALVESLDRLAREASSAAEDGDAPIDRAANTSDDGGNGHSSTAAART